MRLSLSILTLLVAAGLLAGPVAHAEQNAALAAVEADLKKAYPNVELVSPDALNEWRNAGKPLVVIDARTEAEFAVSHIEGARRVDPRLSPAGFRDTFGGDLTGKTVVVYFYPKADTPGCTTEACGFRDSADEYKKAGVEVVGISPDPVEDVKAFAEKFQLNFPLLADADHKVCEAYGVWQERSMAGRSFMGAARTTFVVGPDGHAYMAYYTMERQPDGSWRISGCHLVELEDQSA